MVNARWEADFTARARAYWTAERTRALAGDRRLLLPPADAAPLLRALGLLHRDASMPPPQVRKYFQVNHMVALLLPAIRALRERHGNIALLDAGCGRSYLSLLLAWCAREVWKHPLTVRGIDRDAAVIDECRRRAELAGLDDVCSFDAAALDTIDARGAHGVIALHACDTATCDAIALGVSSRADLIAVAPCCQAELARGWATLPGGPFAAIHGAPHLRRETAADVTDAMRSVLLRAAGYDVAAIEFVPSEHTRKNTLIRALRSGTPDPGARAEYEALRDATGGIGLGLAARV